MLRKDAKIELLRRVPLFAGCSKRELAAIASLADELHVPAASELTHEGASGREFVILVEGEAHVVRRGRVIATLAAGDFVGEIALVTGSPRTATVRTHGPARLLVVTASGFGNLMRDVPSIQTKVLAELAARVPPEFE